MTNILHQVKALCLLYPAPKQNKKIKMIGPSPQISYPCGFFDGATANDLGGVGLVLHLSDSHFLVFSLDCAKSTNTRAELLALWALLTVSKLFGIPLQTIFGDFLVIINWVNIISYLESPSSSHWCKDIRSLIHLFSPLTLTHIYCDNNQQANCLSKKYLVLDPGIGFYSEFMNGMIMDRENFRLF